MRLLLLALLSACSGKSADTPAPGGTDPGGGAEGGDDGGGDGDDTDAQTGDEGGGVGGDEGGGDGGDGSSPDDTAADDTGGGDTGPVDDPDTVRFVALGDAGEGNTAQYTVAAAIEAVCAEKGCDFALYLGDNFYENGVESVDDELFRTAFELPYAYLDFPFYAVLGNHDYGGNGTGWEWWKADYEVEYTDHSDKWTMPDRTYSLLEGPAEFFGLDTTAVYWGFGEDQAAWLAEALGASTATWKVAFGHHPFISNGLHGNAGNYEGLDWLPIVNGAAVESFMEDSVCGKVDVYLCGHDHDRQWLEPTCGTEFIVSGAGSKTTEMVGRDSNPSFFEESLEGFLWVEITPEQFYGEFYDLDGNLEYSRALSR